MAPTIMSPVKGFTGTVVGVDFKNGIGETEDPAALAYFERQGYEISTDSDTASDETKLSPKEALQAEAKELGLSTEGTKADLEARIAEHKTAGNADDSDQKGTGANADGGEE